MVILACQFEEDRINETLMEKAYSLLPDWRRKSARKEKSKGGRLRSLTAGLLLNAGLQIFNNNSGEEGNDTFFSELTFEKLIELYDDSVDFNPIFGDNGKPQMPEGGYFSLSHTKNVALVCVSKFPVGADIEGNRTVRKGPERYFTEREQEELTSDESLFFRFWTRHEAYVKLTGQGLSGLNESRKEENYDGLTEEHFLFHGFEVCVLEKKTPDVL